ncbi:DUF4390 domain-containing protein [Undibacterium curvum]|uniref:DUF4390 domain-containing protein n=1 Tax=Undibacterium curvum TaxID=2762294 RepID=A0ABR7A6Z5_9BURK|nr:DUF4390 domain-containing protein [Undibacterium curvum]MBC3932673.1 DUF4390 domain-containing protein [Undibacterium curvum]
MLLSLKDKLNRLLLTCVLALTAILICPQTRAAEVEITSARIETSDEGYKLSASFAFELSHGLVDAISKEIPISFTTEVELTRPRWYWFDEKTIRAVQTVRIGYNPWTRQYTASINNGLQQSFPTLEEAMALVLRPRRWVVADKGTLTNGAVYNVAVKLKLDLSYLPKTFLITSINNSDWRFSSDWKRFTFKAEDK